MDMDVAPPLVSSIQRLHLGFTDFFGGRFALSSNPATPESSEFCHVSLHHRRAPPAPDPPSSSGAARRDRLFREGAAPLFILGEAEIVRISKNADAKMMPLMVGDRGRPDDFVAAPSHGISASEENVSSNDGGWIGKVAMASVQVKKKKRVLLLPFSLHFASYQAASIAPELQIYWVMYRPRFTSLPSRVCIVSQC
jgi:hypothetical protein